MTRSAALTTASLVALVAVPVLVARSPQSAAGPRSHGPFRPTCARS